MVKQTEEIDKKKFEQILIKNISAHNVVFVRDTLHFNYPSLVFLYNRLIQKIFDNKVQVVEKNLTAVFFGDYENIHKNLVDIELQMTIKGDPSKNDSIKNIDEKFVISSYHKGKYPSTISTYKKLQVWAKENGYILTGNVMHKLIIPIASVETPEDMVLEILVPVLKKT